MELALHAMQAGRANAISPLAISFCPNDTQLIECYLRHEIADGDELHDDYGGGFFIRGVDVYSAAPYDLVAGHAPAPGTTGDAGGHGGVWYFFNDFSRNNDYASAASRRQTRRSRTVAGSKGRWHTEAGRKQVAGGYMSKFSYKEITSSSSGTMKLKPGGWLMTEYGIQGYDIVIAKIYRSPRRHPATTSYTASSSTAAFTWSLQEMESFLMTDDPPASGGALTPVEQLSHSHQVVQAAAAAAANVVVGQNQTVLGVGAAYAQSEHVVTPEPAIGGTMLAADVVIQPHIGSTSGAGLPNHQELDDQFAFDDDGLLWDYYYNTTYFG